MMKLKANQPFVVESKRFYNRKKHCERGMEVKKGKKATGVGGDTPEALS